MALPTCQRSIRPSPTTSGFEGTSLFTRGIKKCCTVGFCTIYILAWTPPSILTSLLDRDHLPPGTAPWSPWISKPHCLLRNPPPPPTLQVIRDSTSKVPPNLVTSVGGRRPDTSETLPRTRYGGPACAVLFSGPFSYFRHSSSTSCTCTPGRFPIVPQGAFTIQGTTFMP